MLVVLVVGAQGLRAVAADADDPAEGPPVVVLQRPAKTDVLPAQAQPLEVRHVAVLVPLRLLVAARGQTRGADVVRERGAAERHETRVGGASAQMLGDGHHPPLLGTLFQQGFG